MKNGTVKGFALISLLVLGITLAGLTPASAHGWHHRMKKHLIMHGGPIPFYLLNQDALKLSHDQVRSLVDLKVAYRKKAIMEKAKIHVLRIDLMARMHRRSVDLSKVDADLDQILAHKRSLMRSFFETVSKANTVLTPAQFDQAHRLFREMIRSHHGFQAARS